ncbi:hypothetical protein JCM19239_7848 [Vibrio variabilis]|uniref:Uncharacterized protein n=1 Tax=Vibrio variabilis TaxID=990271 RepID=A0ABQ0JMJ8_9VIBR|nr:hypothetical protein JCM19239_7848 [Vibrio variabilis]
MSCIARIARHFCNLTVSCYFSEWNLVNYCKDLRLKLIHTETVLVHFCHGKVFGGAMVFSVFQFIITSLLAMICARTIGVTEGDIPVLAVMIPALWILPQGGVAGLMLLASMVVYGLTLPLQSIAMSVAVWILIPVFMVAFSKRSNIWIVSIVGLIVFTLNVGIMLTQSAGKLGGTPMVTLVQAFSVFVAWYAAKTGRLNRAQLVVTVLNLTNMGCWPAIRSANLALHDRHARIHGKSGQA